MEVLCPTCGKFFKKKGLSYHKWRMHGLGIRHNPNRGFKEGTRKQWNLGLTKDVDARVAKNALSLSTTLKKQVAEGTYVVRKAGQVWRDRLSIEQSLNNRGGRCKWYVVAGQKVQGTWEKRLAEKFLMLKVKWFKLKLRKDVWLYLDDEGFGRAYTPDFFLPEYNVYLDPKGYWWGNDKRKIELVKEQHKDKRLIIVKKDLFNRMLRTSTKDEFAALV